MSFIRSVVAAAALALSLQSAAHDLVSGDAAGAPLPPADILTSEGENFWPLDVSDNGRYVLFANYQLGARITGETTTPPALAALDADCTIYRKDRVTGDLLTVFESTVDQRYYCNGALLSADGNTVVAAVAAPPSIPAGVTTGTGLDFGDVVEAEVLVIDAGARTDVTRRLVLANANDIARIMLGNGNSPLAFYPAPTIAEVSDDGQLALFSRASAAGVMLLTSFYIADLAAGNADELLADPTASGSQLTAPVFDNVTLSDDGTTMLLSLDVGIEAGTGQLLPGSNSLILCGQTGRCERTGAGQNQVPCQQTPCAIERVEQRFYLQDTSTRAFTEVEELRAAIDGGAAGAPRPLLPHSLTRDAALIQWVEAPVVASCPFGLLDANRDGLIDCPDANTACADGDCELRIFSFNLARRERAERTTAGNQTLPGDGRIASFSANGGFLLYSRVVTQPFDADFALPKLPVGGGTERYTCIDKSSIDSMSGVPVVADCVPTAFGPTAYNAPVLWGLLNLETGAQNLLSVHDGNLFQSNYALLSGDGLTVVHHTRDPRLRTDMLTNASLDEELLPDECFWPEGPNTRNLRVATNDNVTYFESDTQYVYEAAPTLCVVPSPVIEGQVFATDLGQRTSSGPRVVRASSFGWLLLPLAGLLMWRRRHGLLRTSC